MMAAALTIKGFVYSSVMTVQCISRTLKTGWVKEGGPLIGGRVYEYYTCITTIVGEEMRVLQEEAIWMFSLTLWLTETNIEQTSW